jgi:hypothetical protein
MRPRARISILSVGARWQIEWRICPGSIYQPTWGSLHYAKRIISFRQKTHKMFHERLPLFLESKMKKPDYGIIVKGGQGRDAEAVRDAAFWFGVAMFANLIVIVLGLLGLFRGN